MPLSFSSFISSQKLSRLQAVSASSVKGFHACAYIYCMDACMDEECDNLFVPKQKRKNRQQELSCFHQNGWNSLKLNIKQLIALSYLFRGSYLESPIQLTLVVE